MLNDMISNWMDYYSYNNITDDHTRSFIKDEYESTSDWELSKKDLQAHVVSWISKPVE